MRAQRGAVSIVLAAVLVAAAVGGAGVGVALDQAGAFGSSSGSTTVAGVQTATFYACPDGAPVGVFHSGDRVLVTGRDKASAWAEVRSPADLGGRVWVRAAYVTPDGDLGGVPVHPCESTAPTATSTTTTTAAPGAPEAAPDTPTTTTTRPGATAPPAAPPAGGGGGSTGGGTPQPPPADTTGPAINQASPPNPGQIWEGSNGNVCVQGPHTAIATVTAIVTDPSGIQSVTLSWDGPKPGSVTMGGGPTYSGTIGPFPLDLTSTSVVLNVTITARDSAGNTSKATVGTLTVNTCQVIG